MRILITGATGFIGFNLTKFLLAKGHQVLALTRNPQASSQLSALNIPLIHGDIRELDKKNVKDISADVLFHLAGLRGEGRGSQEKYSEINIEGTRRVLSAFGNKVKRFIYCSSVGVIGHSSKKPVDEESECEPASIYCWSKYQAEKLVKQMCSREGIPWTIIRPAITYGPYDFYGMVVKLFRMLESHRFFPVGPGTNRVHLAYISDLVEGFYLAMKESRAEGEIFIIAGENPISINKLTSLVAAELNQKVPKLRVPVGLAKVGGFLMEKLYSLMPAIFSGEPIVTRDKVNVIALDYHYSIDKAMKLLGYHPKVDYEEGIKLTANWLVDNNIIGIKA